MLRTTGRSNLERVRREQEATEAAAEDRARDVLAAATALAPGDLVIHAHHGLGRFERLVTIKAHACHDAFEIAYRDGKLLVPAEDSGLLSRYGSAQSGARLDRLGGTAWQTRKGRVVRRIDAIARRLIGIAAERALATAPVLKPSKKDYRRFVARFPFEPTPDQAAAIADTERDLASGRPMDRLICGDVGSGKTEIALRAAFIAARGGVQVAVVVPTTLLARQHAELFRQRFRSLPVEIAQISRLAGGKRSEAIKANLATGKIQIAIGTHALLAEGIAFKNLGLLVIDEEQRFGVQHKERLKQLREGVHVLTLTATPIPRTMQLALSPVRELSLIVTPPAGRRPVETIVAPADPATIGKALIAERDRGGQSFYVCPRIADLEGVARMLAERVPQVKAVAAHGRMPARELDRIMQDFAERRFDVLLSTTIIESGLDVPSANTLVVHDAHKLGLAQLYQLRGRVGRSKAQAFAYLAVPPDRDIGATARRRLEVLTSLDTVGAGFSLASHDMDIRGAGNLVGEEQAGHVEAVGFDLFQTLLKRAIAALRRGETRDWSDVWVPRLALDLETRLAASYVAEESQRIDLYWRLAQLETDDQVEAFAGDLAKSFGPLPRQAERLLSFVRLRASCQAAEIAEIVAGPKGAVFTARARLRLDRGCVDELARHVGPLKAKRDGRYAVRATWNDPEARLAGVANLVRILGRARPSLRQAPDSTDPNLAGRPPVTSGAAM